MDWSVLEENSSFKMLGLKFFSKLNWGSYVISIAKTSFKKMGALIRFKKVFEWIWKGSSFQNMFRFPFRHQTLMIHIPQKRLDLDFFQATLYFIIKCQKVLSVDVIVFEVSLPKCHLFVYSQQWNYQSDVWNLLKVNNKYIGMTLLTSFWRLYC